MWSWCKKFEVACSLFSLSPTYYPARASNVKTFDRISRYDHLSKNVSNAKSIVEHCTVILEKSNVDKWSQKNFNNNLQLFELNKSKFKVTN